MFSFSDIFKYKRHLTLQAVETKYLCSIREVPKIDLRKKVPIVAIDDHLFTPENNLKNSGFLIEKLSDIQRINQVESYQIILCDINGIGTELSTETQGAYVIQEIKHTYPEKIVVAYTAASTTSELFQRAREVADFYIKKDASVDEWRDLLDDIIKHLSNPISVWKKKRFFLLESGIELEELLSFEQIILENIGKDTAILKEALNKKMDSNNSAWKTDISRFLASKAFELAFESIFK